MAPSILSRPVFPLVAAILLVGAAAATTSLTVTVGPEGATVHLESDDLPDLSPPPKDGNGTRPPPDNGTRNDTFSMKVDPPSQTVAPGEDAKFLVHLSATRDVVVNLDAKGSPGFDAELGASKVALRKGESASVRLVVHAPGNESRGHVNVNATAADTGERHRASVEVVVEAPPANLTAEFRPWSQNATPGETLTYVLHAGSTQNRTLRLDVTSLPPGYAAELSQATLDVGPQRRASANLTVHVPANATKGGEIRVLGWTAEGERVEAVAFVVLHEATTQPSTNATSEEGATTTQASAPIDGSPPADPAPLAAPPASPLRARAPTGGAHARVALPMI